MRIRPAMRKQMPVRVGVFDLYDVAEMAVQGLVDAGFDPEQITVVCSERAGREKFPDVDAEPPAGATMPERAVVGGAIGALLGGLGATLLVTSGGLVLLGAGAMLFFTGASTGSFVGAMTSRGVEKEVANFYDQELEKGQILVAVTGKEHLEEAERVFAELGTRPFALPEG
jgi:hypothetical protein